MLLLTVTRRKIDVTVRALVFFTVEAVRRMQEERKRRHVLHTFTRAALRAPQPLEPVFLHKVFDQERLVGTDRRVTKRTTALVVAVVALAHLASPHVVVKH